MYYLRRSLRSKRIYCKANVHARARARALPRGAIVYYALTCTARARVDSHLGHYSKHMIAPKLDPSAPRRRWRLGKGGGGGKGERGCVPQTIGNVVKVLASVDGETAHRRRRARNARESQPAVIDGRDGKSFRTRVHLAERKGRGVGRGRVEDETPFRRAHGATFMRRVYIHTYVSRRVVLSRSRYLSFVISMDAVSLLVPVSLAKTARRSKLRIRSDIALRKIFFGPHAIPAERASSRTWSSPDAERRKKKINKKPPSSRSDVEVGG